MASVETISQLEADLESCLEELRALERRGELPAGLRSLLALAPPEGASVHVSLRLRENGRRLRRGAPVREWHLQSGAVWIVYEFGPVEEARQREPSVEPLDEFILALDHAEREPHLSFISLKWFRDTYLSKRGLDWADDPDIPRRLIQDATDAQILLTHKVQNPKQPEFPVTSIVLNRQHPRVVKVLGAAGPQGEPPRARESGA